MVLCRCAERCARSLAARLSSSTLAKCALTGKITLFTNADGVAALGQSFEVPARETQVFDLTQMQPQGTFVSAMVEIYGGGGFVEQRADSASGSAVSSCSNSTSSTWYFADGYTVDNSSEQLVITNPFPSDAIVNISESTATESRRPAILQSLLVKAESVLVISQDLLAKRELNLAITVDSTRGRVVVGRSQEYLASAGRAGFTMTLGAPSLGEQFYFADGEVGPNVIERYSIYNGSDTDAVVNVAFLGLDPAAGYINPEPLTVPAGKVVSLIAGEQGLPAGRHGAVFSTETAGSILVERAITRTTGDTVATTVVMGSPPTFASTRWSMAIGTDLAVDNILVVLERHRRRRHRHGEDARRRRRGAGARHGGDPSPRGRRDHDRGDAIRQHSVIRWWSNPRSGSSSSDSYRAIPTSAVVRVRSPFRADDRGPVARCRRGAGRCAGRRRRAEAAPRRSTRRRNRCSRPPHRSTEPTSKRATRLGSLPCSRRLRARPATTSSARRGCCRAMPVAVVDVEYSASPALHRKYHIDAVPIVVVADSRGVVRASFVGPMSATDLWAAVAEARDPGSSPEPNLGRN